MSTSPRTAGRRARVLARVGPPVAVAIAALGAALAAPAAAATTTSASSVLASTKKAIAKQSGVHLVLKVKDGSSSSTTVVEDSGDTSGVETISEGKATASIKVTSKNGYISGNSTGLTKLLGLTAAQAKKAGAKWVTFASGSTEYSDLKTDVTISQVDGVLPTSKGEKLNTETVHGVKLYLLTWTTKATSSAPKIANTLTLSASGPPLPVTKTETASGGRKESISLSKWGEQVVVKVPSSGTTIAYSKI